MRQAQLPPSRRKAPAASRYQLGRLARRALRTARGRCDPGAVRLLCAVLGLRAAFHPAPPETLIKTDSAGREHRVRASA